MISSELNPGIKNHYRSFNEEYSVSIYNEKPLESTGQSHKDFLWKEARI
jgi:hypothetical protein